jgi:hypothetical protein
VPAIIHAIVERLHWERRFDDRAVATAFDGLLAEPDDPTGLRTRLGELAGWSLDAVDTLVLLGAVDRLTRTDLADRVRPADRAAVVAELEQWLERGFLVERDGRILPEHPLVADRIRQRLGDPVPF